MNLPEKILKLRNAGGLSQDLLAERLNVTRQSVSKWETGQAAPELENVVKLAEIFEVDTDYFLYPSQTDELRLKTAALERQQQEILNAQRRTQNRQFAALSALVSLLAILVVYFVGEYVMFPDLWEGRTLLGKTVILYGGTAIIVALTLCLNWRYRTRHTRK